MYQHHKVFPVAEQHQRPKTAQRRRRNSMNDRIFKLFRVTVIAIMMFQSGCSDSAQTNMNIPKNSNNQNKNAAVDPTIPSINTARASNGPAIVISAVDIAREFNKDNFAADKKFGGKQIEVTGTVETIELRKDPGAHSSVYLRGHKNHMVECIVPQPYIQKVEQLKKGNSVTFIGTESETSLNKQLQKRIGKEIGGAVGWNVEITDCVFK